MLHIPCRGQPEATTAIVTVEVQVMALTMALSTSRVAAGSRFAGFDVSAWFAYLAPAGTPAPIVQRLNAELAAAIRHPEDAKRLDAVSAGLNPGTPRDLAKFLEAGVERWAGAIRQAGVKIG